MYVFVLSYINLTNTYKLVYKTDKKYESVEFNIFYTNEKSTYGDHSYLLCFSHIPVLYTYYKYLLYLSACKRILFIEKVNLMSMRYI